MIEFGPTIAPWILSIFVGFGLLNFVYKLMIRRTGGSLRTLLFSILNGSILYFLLSGKLLSAMMTFIDSFSKKMLGDLDKVGLSDQTTELFTTPVPAPPIENSAPITPPMSATPPETTPFDPSPLFGLLSVIAVVVVVSLVAFGATHLARWQLKKNKTAKSNSELLSKILSQASEKISATLVLAATYETDLAKQIEFPLMTDITKEPVALYVKNMRRALASRDALPSNPTIEMVNDYFATANDFEVSFTAAEEWSTKMKWSTFSVEESRRLNDAKVSLALLEDSTTSSDQRNALYRRLEKLLTGLVNITDQVKLSLSSKVPMLALESVS